MKIKMMRNTVVGGQDVSEGQLVEASEAEARYLIGIGKAVAVSESPSIETGDAAAADAIETTDAVKSPRKKNK